jgi:hypothetical protein
MGRAATSISFDPDYGQPTNHPNDPRNDDFDEFDEDKADAAEREAEAEADMLGCYPDWQR